MSHTSLFLITSHFPYLPGEQFLEEEIPLISNQFDEIIIFPTNPIIPDSKRVIPSSIKVVTSLISKKANIFTRLRRTGAFINDEMSRKWWQQEKNENTFGIGGLLKLTNWMSIAHEIKQGLTPFIEQALVEKKQVLLYSYWLSPAALAISMLKEKYPIIVVARAHGGDLYEYRHNPAYLPFQKKVINHIDHVFAISEDGKNYLLKKNHTWENKITISRLGTKRCEQRNPNVTEETLHLITCSYLKPVKRIPLLIDALKKCTIPIRWTHIGDGPDKLIVEEKIQQLPENISVTLTGSMNNSDILHLYMTQPFSIFVNVSESEGVPVSIMEAFSCGIPAIATDVGGTRELVNEETGQLIPKNITPENLAQSIINFATLSQTEQQKKRQAALDMWETYYDSTQNYCTFGEMLKNVTSLD